MRRATRSPVLRRKRPTRFLMASRRTPQSADRTVLQGGVACFDKVSMRSIPDGTKKALYPELVEGRNAADPADAGYFAQPFIGHSTGAVASFAGHTALYSWPWSWMR